MANSQKPSPLHETLSGLSQPDIDAIRNALRIKVESILKDPETFRTLEVNGLINRIQKKVLFVFPFGSPKTVIDTPKASIYRGSSSEINWDDDDPVPFAEESITIALLDALDGIENRGIKGKSRIGLVRYLVNKHPKLLQGHSTIKDWCKTQLRRDKSVSDYPHQLTQKETQLLFPEAVPNASKLYDQLVQSLANLEIKEEALKSTPEGTTSPVELPNIIREKASGRDQSVTAHIENPSSSREAIKVKIEIQKPNGNSITITVFYESDRIAGKVLQYRVRRPVGEGGHEDVEFNIFKGPTNEDMSPSDKEAAREAARRDITQVIGWFNNGGNALSNKGPSTSGDTSTIDYSKLFSE